MSKNTYTAWAQNDQGASMTIGKYTNYTDGAREARRQLGAGWTVHIEDQDGVEIMQFTITRSSAAAATLGHFGGSVKSDAKVAAARENGRKGGRPRKEKK
jgi:hypothetical protein